MLSSDAPAPTTPIPVEPPSSESPIAPEGTGSPHPQRAQLVLKSAQQAPAADASPANKLSDWPGRTGTPGEPVPEHYLARFKDLYAIGFARERSEQEDDEYNRLIGLGVQHNSPVIRPPLSIMQNAEKLLREIDTAGTEGILRPVAAGTENFAASVNTLGYSAAKAVTDLGPQDNFASRWLGQQIAANRFGARWVEPPKTGLGEFLSVTTQFALGYSLTGGLLSAAGAPAAAGGMTGFGQTLAQGAVADTISFDGHSERLSNVIQKFPALQNPITDYLSAKPDDSEAEARFKQALEGMGMSAGISAVLKLSTKAFSAGARVVANGGTKAEASAAINTAAKELQPEIDAALAKAAKEQPSNEAIQKKAYELWEAAGKPQGRDVEFWNTAKQVLTKAPDPEIAASKPFMSDSAKDSLVKQIADVGTGRVDIEGRVVGEDFNYGRMLSDNETKVAMNALGEEGAQAIFDAKGGIRPYDETFNAAAAALKEDPANFYAELAQAAKIAPEQARLVVGGKMMLQKIAGDITRRATGLSALGKTPQEIRAELGPMLDAFANVYKNTKAVITGGARATGAGNILTGEMLGAMSDADVMALAGRLATGDGGAEFVARTAKPEHWMNRLLRLHNFVWINGLLSAAKTAVVNLDSNTVKAATMPGEIMAGAVMTGDIPTFLQGAKMYHSMMESTLDAIRFAAKSFRADSPVLMASENLGSAAGRPISAAALGRDGKIAGSEFLGNVADGIGAVIGLPSRLAMSSDEFSKQVLYRAYIRSQAWSDGIQRGLTGDELAAHVANKVASAFDAAGRGIDETGKLIARDGTFTREFGEGGIVGPALEGASQYLDKHPIGKIVAPFFRIGVNMPIEVLAHSPAAPLYARTRADLFSKDRAVAAMARGKIAVGSALAATAVYAAANDSITGGGPANPEARKLWMDAGNRPYSFKWTDESGTVRTLSYQRMEPWGTFFGIAADYAEIANHVDENTKSDAALQLTMAFANNTLSKTYVVGMAQALDAMTDKTGQALERWYNRQVGSYVPSFVAGFKDDPYQREVRSGLDAIKNRIPGLSETLPPKRNFLGEPMPAPDFIGPDFLSPFAYSKTLPTPVAAELARFGKQINPPGRYLGDLDLQDIRNAKGQTVYDRWLEKTGQVEIGGRTLAQTLQTIIERPSYQALPAFRSDWVESERLARLRNPIAMYRQRALYEALAEFPEIGGKDAVMEVKRKAIMAKRYGVGVQVQE